MATTPAEWLPILAARLDDRQPRIAKNRSYANGHAPLPEMGANTKATWKAFQKKARTNFGGLSCESLGGRMVPNGVRVGTSMTSPGVLAARRVWRDNRLDVVFGDAISNMLTTSVGYLVTGVRNGDPVITSEMPEQVITAPDPTQPWRARAALKAWRDQNAGKDYALVWLRGQRQLFVRDSKTISGTLIGLVAGEWEASGPLETYAGGVPVYVLENKDGVAEFEPHIDVIDRINLGKLQRLVVTAMQAFKQRAIKGGLPEQDEDGNDINWAKVFEPAPGALWDLPEGIDVWESEQTDIRPLLEGEKADARDFAGAIRTPISVFIPSGENQSAEGAANAKEGEIQKAKNRIARVTAPMSAALLEALRILGIDDGETVEVLWMPPEHVSFTEKTQAAMQAKAAGMSARWIKQNIMGMSPDEIAQDETDAATDQLLAATLSTTGLVTWGIFKRIGGTATEVIRGGVLGLTANAVNTFNMALTVSGLNGSAVVNGVTASGALLQADADALAGATSAGLGVFGGTSVAGSSVDSFSYLVSATPSGQKLTVYNGSMPGSRLDYQSARLATMVPVRPDLVFLSSGHNYTSGLPTPYIAAFTQFVTDLRDLYPGVPVTVSSQNPEFLPWPNVGAHLDRLVQLRILALRCGWGYLPVLEAFMARPDGGQSLVIVDGIHPTADGSILWRSVASAYLAAKSFSPA